MRFNNHVVKVLSFLILLIPVCLGAFILHTYGVNTLMMDEFIQVPLAVSDHLPSMAQFFHQHSEHRIFFPKIVYFFVAKTSNMSSLAVMWVSFTLVVALYATIVWYVIRRIAGKGESLALSLIIGLALFHPAQNQNILWGFQIAFFMVLVFSVLTFLCFQMAWDETSQSPRYSWLIIAVLCGFVATLSSGQGLIVWPVLLGVWLAAARKKTFTSLRFWLVCLAGALAISLYFYGYRVLDRGGISHNVKEFWHYFLVFLGSSSGAALSSSSLGKSEAYGWGILAATAAMFLHFLFKRPKGTLFPVAVALWSLAVAVLISYGRASLQQQEGGIASRYTTFILPLVWTLLLYLALWSGRFGKLWRRIIIFSSCLAALLFLGHNLTALWERLDAQCIHNSRLQYLLLTADIHPDDNMVPPKILEGRGNFFKAAKVREFVAILRDKGLNAFADVEEEKPPFAEKKSLGEPANGFALEALSIEKGKLNAEPFLRLVGWAFDATANKPARSVWLTIGTGTDERRLPLFYGTINRQQIADYLRNKELNRVGFEGDFTLKTIHPGVYPLSLEIVSSDGLAFWRFAVPCQLFVNEGSWRLQSPDGDTCQPGIPVRERIMAVPAAGEVVGRLDEARLEHGANGPELFVRGWARDPKQQLPATAVTLEAGERQFPLAYGINRPDVGQHFKTGKLNRTGFQAQIPLSFLTPGRYPLSLRVDARFDAFYFFVDSGFKLVSRDGDWHLEKQR